MKNIGIIGAGNLGTRLVSLMCRNRFNIFLTVSDKNILAANKLVDMYEIEAENTAENIKGSDFLFLAVKPNNIKEVCQQINTYTEHRLAEPKIIITAAAGVPVIKIKEWTNNNHDVIRCMPNLPISDGDGSIVWYSNKVLDESTKCIVDSITEGPEALWVSDETLMDPATIISGCSPAYIAKFYQTYVEIGVEMGFSKLESELLMKQAISGTLKMLKETSPDDIMKQVASKGGATEKGLEMLERDGFSAMIHRSSFSSLDRIEKITKNLD